MKENSDIDGGGKGDSSRSAGRSQGPYGGVKRVSGNRSRARREQKERSDVVDSHSTTNPAGHTSQPVKVLPQATAEQIRIAQLLSNGEEEIALKMKVSQVVELTDCDQDTAALSLHDCDGDTNLAVHMILDARANAAASNGFDEQKQDEWQTTSKRHPKKSISTSEPTNGQNHDGSSTDRGDDWSSSKAKEISRDRRSARRGVSERRGGSRPRPGSGANDALEDPDRRRNRSERRGRGSARGRSERGGRQRPGDSISPGGKDDNHFVNGSSDNDFGAFGNDAHGSSSRERGMPPRFDGVRRGGRGSMRGGGGGRVFSSRGGRGGRGRSRLSYGHFREKVPGGSGDGSNSMNWTGEQNEKVEDQPHPSDEGWDDMSEWDSSVWQGQTQVYTNSKVTKQAEETCKLEDSQPNSDEKNGKLLATTSVEDDDPAIVNSVSSAQYNQAAIAAYNYRATEVIKTSLGIGSPTGISTTEEPKPQRQPRVSHDKTETSSPNLASLDKHALRAALEEEILGGVGPKHAKSKAPPPSKKPDKPVELPRMRGLPVNTSSGMSFGFGLLDDLKTSPVKSSEENAEVDTNVDSASQSCVNVEPDVGKPTSDANAQPDSTIQEYLSSSMNSSSFQSTERQPTPVTNTVSPVKPPSISTTPNQYHSPLKAVDSEDGTVSSNDPFQSQANSLSTELAVELSSKLSTRPENEQSSQTANQETTHPELQSSRTEIPSVPSVMDKATQPTPSSSQQNTPNKATGVSRSQQTNAPQNAVGGNILGTLPSAAAVSALLNYSHLTTTGHPNFPYINIPTMPQHGTIDYEQIVQQQQRIIYDLALQQQQHPPQHQPANNQTPQSQQSQHHNQHQNVHQLETTTSNTTVGSSGSSGVNVSGSNSVSGNGLKAMPTNMRGTTVGDVPVQSPTTALPGSALPHMQTVASSVVSTASGVGTTATHHNMFMPPGYPPYYPNYYPTNPAAAAVGAPPPGHHPNAGTAPPYNPATFLSIMNSINQQPVSQALSSPPHFGSSMGVGKGQSNNVFGSYPDRSYAGSSTSGFDDHMQDMKYSSLNTGKEICSTYGGNSSGSAKPSSLGVGPASSAYHSGVTSGGGHRGSSSISESNGGARNSGNTGLDSGSKNVTGTGAVAPGAGASGFPFLTGNPGLYNATGYMPFMAPPHHHHHHLAAQGQQERQGTNSGVPQGAAAGSLPGGPQFGSKGNSSVFSKQATAILHQNYHPSGASTPYWNNLK